jgi:AraC-like DNA-binding protein
MDKSLRKRTVKTLRGSPVVVLANWFQFAPSERHRNKCVESRMFLWCRSGSGIVRVNGIESAFSSGDWVLLPWRHDIAYIADARSPFFVGGIHIIPSHSKKLPVVFRVAHNRADDLAGQPGRSDAAWPGMEGIVRGRFAGGNDSMALLAAFIVEKFQHSRPERGLMQNLAALLIAELSLAVCAAPAGAKPRPGTLHRMQEYVRAHPDRRISILDLANLAKCSTASVHRQFQTCESLSPRRWIARQRVGLAATLLRTTTLTVREVGERVGLDDPFHFSRYFKKETGESPAVYRKGRGFF